MKMAKSAKAAALAAALLTVTVLSACSKDEVTADKAAKEGEKPNLTVSMYDRGNVPKEMGTIDNNRWTKWLNENVPVNAQYIPIPRGESVQKLNLLFASGDAPDVVFEFDTGFRNQLYQQKQLLPVDDLIEKYSTNYKELMEKYPVMKKAAVKPDGKMYEFGRVGYLTGFQALFIRQDWLDNLGLKAPETAEEFFEVAKAFTEQDPDGNGVNDTFGTALSGETGGTIGTMFQSVGWVLQDGKLVRAWDQANAANDFKKRLYDAGTVDKDFLADKNGQKAQQDWNNGKIGIFVGRTIDLANVGQYYEQLKKNVPEAEVKAIKLPSSEFGRFAIGVNNPVQMTTVINANAKNPEAAMQYIDFMASKEAVDMLRFGEEGVDSVKGENGCLRPIDGEKFNQEVAWNLDFQLLLSRVEMGECGSILSQLDPSKPLEKEFMELVKENDEANLSPDVEYASITHGEHMPTLPDDLSVINANVSKIDDIYNKAITSGSAYTVDQAYADALNLWKKSGGEQLETFYADWYDTNKDTAFLAKDMWEFIEPKK
ncbi:extracellular solute-binding protein [Saccharibacillus sp. CPCC 101409]|uniref:extracellular solute-binding protein n=1 Tax=Saccharibacillus sp. CPCC 101409 TaxID=3058041 RepID=UPI002672AFCF|nr:extracellular solute-binding protein [Saccharibacillus sp. CPCC 101409]MDO3408688.1 extracellular solute-binding protein [Saccharibacillus sp. CPCC 101409]